MNILFICTGNHNRSPAAHAIFKNLSPKDSVKSAGTDIQSRQLFAKDMRDALHRRGYKYPLIYSKSVTKALINWSDVVFYMQPSHLRYLNKFGKSVKYVPLAKYVSEREIHDPWQEGEKAYDRSVKEIEKAIKNFLKSRK